jgi:hypothetical protein
VLALLAILVVSIIPVAALGDTVITVETDHQIGGGGDYSGYSEVDITGTVSPNPSGASVALTIKNPNGLVVVSDIEPVNLGANGFEDLVVLGCTPNWVTGTYTIVATLEGTPAVTATTEFGYLLVSPAEDNISMTATPGSVSADGTVTIAGGVQACSGSAGSTSVLISVKNQAGRLVYSGAVPVLATNQPWNGTYSLQLAAGSSPNWISGNYSAVGYFSSNSNSPSPASASAEFEYSINTTASATANNPTSVSSTLSLPSTTLYETSSTQPATSSSSSSSSATSTTSSENPKGGGDAGSLVTYGAVAVAAGVAASFVAMRSRAMRKAP